jgi:MFS transporter, NNP family, nitrate/nitrite transporter
MNLRDFRRAGHLPTLICAFLYFDVSFMVWVLIGSLGVSISTQLGLDPVNDAAKKGFLVAVPLLGGSLLRLVLGLLTDHIGARRTALLGMMLTTLPLLLGWLWADTYSEVVLVGLMLGVAGASFAAALPLASRWYPPQYQGLAMGIAGAGNSGTALATFFGPLLARSLGWHSVFGLALIPLLLTLCVFALLAKDSPKQPPAKSPRDYAVVLGYADTWWFCLLYAVTFGGFVGLASFLTIFFKDQYFPLDAKSGEIYAGYITTLCVVSGSFLRPLGGYLADRFGGIRMLMLLYVGAGMGLLALTSLPPLPAAIVLLFGIMGLLGMGNGSVFQLVPQRFPREIGVITGIVGAAGGIGGFLLPNVLGTLKRTTSSFAPGFAVFALMACLCGIVLWRLRTRWESEFLASAPPLSPSTDEPFLVPANASANGS